MAAMRTTDMEARLTLLNIQSWNVVWL